MTVLKPTELLNSETYPNEIDDEELVLVNEKELWKFSKYFWDEKIRGYDLLNQNLRNSLNSIREFERYLRECITSEDQYLKQLNKNVITIEKFVAESTMSPIWFDLLRNLNENTVWSHMHYMNRLNDLTKEVRQHYQDMRLKKRKIKENELKTIQIIENFKAIKQQLKKSKEQYYQLVIELDKLKQTLEINQQQQPINQAVILTLNTNIIKLDKKILNSMEEYKTNIEKYNQIKKEYEQKFIESCDVFQENEENHLKQMRSFIFNFLDTVGTLNQSRVKNHQTCYSKLETKHTVEHLIRKFISLKSTGQTHPRDAEFIEYHDANASHAYSNSYADLSSTPKYDSSRISLKTPDPFDINESNNMNNETSNRKRSDSRFSLFNIDFRGKNRSKKYSKNSNKDILSVSVTHSPSTQTKRDSFKINSQIDQAFDQQLIQINNFENEILNNEINTKSDSIYIVNGKSNSNGDLGYSFNNNPSNFNSDKRLVGSLKTATSLENFYLDINNNNVSNKDLNRLDSIDDGNDLNYFPAFDDLEVEKNMNKNTDMNNFFNESNFSINEVTNNDSSSNNDIIKQKLENPTPTIYSFSYTDTENNFEEGVEDNFSSDSDSDDSDAPKKIHVKINPLSESAERSTCVTPDILNQITKNLQLNLPNQTNSAKNRRNAYKKSLTNIDLLNNQFSTVQFNHNNDLGNLSSEVINLSKSPENINAPPLPPLPIILQQKVKEKQALYNQKHTSFDDRKELTSNQVKSDPIEINSKNFNSENENFNVVKITRKESFKIDSNQKKLFNIVDNSKSNGSLRSLRLNMKLPGEEEMQF